MFSKVLVGVDGQSGGRDATALAGQLVADDGRLVLAHVHPGGERFAKSAVDGDLEIGQHSESLELLERERAAAGCDAETMTIGSPSVSGGLRRLSDDLHADPLVVGSTSHHRLDPVGPTPAERSASLDLLVVGSRGHGPAGRLIFGSTSRYLAQHAHCSLLVLTAGRSEDRGRSGQRIGSESPFRAGSDRAGTLT